MTIAQEEIANLKHSIDAYRRLTTLFNRNRIALTHSALDAYASFKDESLDKNRISSHLFNPMKAIGIGETTHSRIIGDLLNPNGSHGQGNLFLIEFLKAIKLSSPESGSWNITVERGRVDICLRRKNPSSLVIIENKSNWAIDQPGQLYRYWYNEIYRTNSNLKYGDKETAASFKVVYLTPTREKVPSDISLSAPEELSKPDLPSRLPLEVKIFSLNHHASIWLKTCIEQLSPSNQRLKVFLQLYLEIWQ